MAASILPAGKHQFFTNNGIPLVGGKLYTYDAGTVTPRQTDSDASALVPNANPVILDARGEALIFGVGSYKFVLKDSLDNLIWTTDNIVQYATAADVSTVADDLATPNNPAKGAGMVAWSSSTSYPAGTVGKKLADLSKPALINVLDYGAVGDGTTNDTAAFAAAAAVSKSVYVPYISAAGFLINGLNVPVGVRFWGPGVIKTSGGTLINLATADLEEKDGPAKVMFLESDKQGWEEMLDIKTCGYNTIMSYLWSAPSLEAVIYNAEAVGLKVIVHSKFTPANIGSWSTLASQSVAFDSRRSVVGYYVYDEPFGTGISVANQNAGLALYRTLTAKPLSCAETSVSFSTTGAIASSYDQVFVDIYYPDSSPSANNQIVSYLQIMAMVIGGCPQAKIIPLVGLFNDTGFNKSPGVTVKLADALLKFSQDGSFGVFVWNAGTAGTYVGVRNNATYRAAAIRLAGISATIKPWHTELVPIGTQFTASSKLAQVFVNCTDGASPGIPGAASLVPWYVQQATGPSNRQQPSFTDNGLMHKGAASRAGFAGMPAGICAAFLRWDNRETGTAATIGLGASSTLGYSSAPVTSQVINSGTAAAFFEQLDASGSFGNMPTIDVTTPTALNFPFNFLKGYLFFSDIPKVSF